MGTKKSNKLYAAAAALAVTASAVAPGLTADAASKVTVKSITAPKSISHYGGYTFAVKKLSLPKTVKVLLSNKKYENRSVKWGKVSYDKKYVGKYQTISGTVSGTTKKVSIKVKLNNYPVDVVEPKLAPVAVGEKLNLPSTIDVKYKDGKVIARSAKSFNLTAEKTDKAGMMKLSYNYMGKNSSIKGSIAYEVKAAEITNVMDSVKEDVLSVSADVKFPAKDAKAQLLIFPGKDESKALPAIDGKLEGGKFTAEGKDIPAGTHSYSIKIGEVTTPEKEFTVEAPSAKEVKAINAKTLEVQFSKAIDATLQSKATVEVKVNGVASLFKIDKFTGDKATLVRTSGLALETGKYEVVVKGEGLKESKLETTVDAVKPATLVVSNDQLLDATTKAPVKVELKNQYGEEVKFDQSNFTASAFNVTQSKSVSLGFDSTDKFFYLNTATNNVQGNDEFKVGDEIRVSFFHEASGLNVVKTLKVVAGAQLGTLEFGSVVLPTGKDKLTEDLKDIKVPFTAKDQYGNAVDLSSSNVAVISTDDSILDDADVTFSTYGDDKKPALNISKFGKAGKVTLNFLNKSTGEVYKLNVTVLEKAGAISKVATDVTKLQIAESGSAKVSLNVTDNYGTKIDAKDYAAGSAFTITSSNTSVVSSAAINNVSSSDDYGKLVVTLAANAKKGDKATVSITVNKTGESISIPVEVGEAAVPSLIKVGTEDKHASNLIVGGKTTVSLDLFDQYNNAAVNNPAYQVKYEVVGTDKDAITLSETQETAGTLTGTSVDVTGAKAGSAVLVAKLVKGTDEVAKVEIPFTIAKNSSSTFTYSLAEIPTLYKGGAGNDGLDSAETGTNTYAKEVSVKAKAADGSILSVPNSSILNVAVVSGPVDVLLNNGKWYVAGNDDRISDDTKAKIRVNVQTDEGTKTIDQEVTVSKATLAVSAVKLMDKAIANVDTAKELKEISLAAYGNIVFGAQNSPYLWTVDQFGVASDFNVEDADVVSKGAFSGLTSVSDDTFVKGDDVITVTDVNGDTVGTANASYRLTIIEDGAALDVPVKVTAAKLDTTAPTLTGQTLSVDKKTVTLTLSEDVTNNLADAAALKAAIQFSANGTTFVPLNAADTVTLSGKVVKVTFNTALAGATNKVKVNADALKDVSSNKNLEIVTSAINAGN
ncbi:hypothetical protein AS033_00720 [Exiguobacterium indicum]|uniref:Bacterial Ig-like domain-containing protein n=1 Tax=Exiguobacterium indicum TaxID=296995 RepID=A0A0V8GIE5_9BACL|nr:Ig-like domain-containing protein [Exiguobacterium enclense]KSU49921.1 hypothetical protein AS033_00720 [Exiguobacterium enclense]SDB86406.1 hypothetical protein SAMN05216342_0147 [Exiguobacterium enclense]